MTAPPTLLADLRRRGVRVTQEGDRLRVSAPRGALAEPDRAALAAAKPALLELLAAEAADPAQRDHLRKNTSSMAILRDLARLGFRLEARADGLRVFDARRRRPDGSLARGETRMPAALLFALAAHKAAVLALLEAGGVEARPEPAEAVRMAPLAAGGPLWREWRDLAEALARDGVDRGDAERQAALDLGLVMERA